MRFPHIQVIRNENKVTCYILHSVRKVIIDAGGPKDDIHIFTYERSISKEELPSVLEYYLQDLEIGGDNHIEILEANEDVKKKVLQPW